ncbi:LysR family transcriptional regulator [Trinickia caryophylli]|uniref:LysR family transcriptional regulator n=1 Tax=Trinickia caryophylli TaxID=28094 RepID=UPI000A15362C|nr:LysR family transcriptional regulator [Trinickia caryophylli]PMS13341.1 LysR family transcriptional regulator [Trinickia caryophylli]TRX19325.1 LysR family transcriptional regulator [Trinickia caryophylli]WQE13654.1 LysR family transcriptional regulator [Trinickia caryophylli]
MNTRDLEAFVSVVDHGSLVRAAAQLHLTQPGLTRRIQNLETSLGMPLLDRQSKPLKPTVAGREAYALARTVLSALDDLLALGKSDSEPTGELRIGVPPFLSELSLETPIDRLRGSFPRLTLRVTAAWSPALLERAVRAEVDAAVVMMPESVALPESLSTTLLARQPTVIVAGRALGLMPDGPGGMTKPRFALAQLSRYPWVLNQDGCGMRSALSRALHREGLPFDVAVEAFGSDLQLSLVARGVGLGIATPAVLERSPYRDALQPLDVSDFSGGLNVWLVHGSLPGRLARPVALLRETLGEVLAATGCERPAAVIGTPA